MGVDEDLSRYVGYVFRQSDLARSIERRWPEFLNLAKVVVLDQYLTDGVPLAGRMPPAHEVERILKGTSVTLAARLRDRRWNRTKAPNLLAEAIALRLGWRS